VRCVDKETVLLINMFSVFRKWLVRSLTECNIEIDFNYDGALPIGVDYICMLY